MVKKKSEAKKELQDLGKGLVAQIKKGTNPSVEFSLRGISNIKYDEKSRKLNLGDKKQTRQFFKPTVLWRPGPAQARKCGVTNGNKRHRPVDPGAHAWSHQRVHERQLPG